MSDVLQSAGGSRRSGSLQFYAAKGWDVAINYARDAEAAKKVSNEVNAFGERSITIKGDMTSEDDILKMFKKLSELIHIRG